MLVLGFEVLCLAVIAWAALIITRNLRPSAVFGVAIVTQVFAGHWADWHLPIPLDRVTFALAMYACIRHPKVWQAIRTRHFGATEWLCVATAVYALVSATAAGTMAGGSTGFYSWLDRLGVLPFLGYIVAPAVFAEAKDRTNLLRALVVLGAYLGITAVGEALKISALVYPRYILDPTVGMHYGRGRGPFAESVSDGLALFACAVACAMYFKEAVHRKTVALIGIMAAAGTVLTLTRAVWVATILALVVAMVGFKHLRRYILPAAAACLIGVICLFTFVPGFGKAADGRAAEQGPLWDRYNTNHAAIRALEQNPLFGVGWDHFHEISSEYLREASTYPLQGAHLNVHNVFISHATELGLLGFGLWAGALLGMVGRVVLNTNRAVLSWRAGYAAIFVSWAVCACFGPVTHIFTNLLLWLWGGIAAVQASKVSDTPDVEEVSETALDVREINPQPAAVGV